MGIFEDSDFEGEMICKDYRISIPGYNGFEKAEGALYFILSAIYIFCNKNDNNVTVFTWQDNAVTTKITLLSDNNVIIFITLLSGGDER